MSSVLSVEDLNVNRGGDEVLKDLSFSVEEGEVLIILGPNGAGKTTLLKSLIGLLHYEGSVEWSTSKISYLPPQEFLNRDFLLPITVEEFFQLKQVTEGKVREMLDSVGLSKTILSKGFNALSTGQFQRLLIAWALVDEPDVLLFDEPTAGIDVGGEETIYSLLHKFWKEKGITILLVTHDLDVVWEHADNVLCLNKRKLCYGRPNSVLSPKKLKELYGTGIKFYEHGGRDE